MTRDEMAPDEFVALMLAWFQTHGRDLPWRATGDTYRVLVCEVLLRRSRGTTVAKVFHQFFARWPKQEDLAEARVEEVVEIIRPLGLIGRASQLVELGRQLAVLNVMPDTVVELCKLPGVGRYSASATLGAPAVDATTARVYRRYFGLTGVGEHKRVDAELWRLVGEPPVGDVHMSRRLNWAVLDLAASACAPRKPACQHCVLAETCAWNTTSSEAGTATTRRE